MKNLTYLLSLLFFSFLLSQCKKKDPEPLKQLPPATQTGANTFGCLLNGQAWTPNGRDGTFGASNYTVYYDPTYRKGTLNISTYRYLSEDDDKQIIGIYSDSLTAPGTYPLNIPYHQEALFQDRKTDCYSQQSSSHYRNGTLTITKLDLNLGIISGTFEFILAKPGCDTIKVTNGRFDKKL